MTATSPHAELARQILEDLRLTLPEDFSFDIEDDPNGGLIVGLDSATLSGQSWHPPDASRCQVAAKLVSDVQDFMADVYGVWWPMLGRQRLEYAIDCLDDRPKLIFRLARSES